MAIDITDKLENQQQLQVTLAGQTPPQSLLIFTGRAALDFSSNDRNYVFSIGPDLSQSQFIRAIASAGFSSLTINTQPQPAMPEGMGTMGGTSQCGITGVDADWDDETGKVRVRLETVESIGGPTASGQIGVVGYTVHILAVV